MRPMKYNKTYEIRHEIISNLEEKGFYGPVNMFDINELDEVISKFKSIYKDDFIFSNNKSI